MVILRYFYYYSAKTCKKNKLFRRPPIPILSAGNVASWVVGATHFLSREKVKKIVRKEKHRGEHGEHREFCDEKRTNRNY